VKLALDLQEAFKSAQTFPAWQHDAEARPFAKRSDMASHFIPSIRSRLVLLVAVCILPASLIAVILLSHDFYQGREKLVDNSIARARTIASLVDKEFASSEATLRTLATSPSLTVKDLGAFSLQAQEVVRTQAVSNIVLTDPSGQQLTNTLRPFGEPLPHIENPVQLRRLADTDGPVISELFTGVVSQHPVITIAIPVRRNGKYVYNLFAAISPGQFARLIRQQQLPPDWIVVVVDSGGTIVARSHEMKQFVGQRSVRSLRNAMAFDNEGSFKGPTSEGISVLGVFSRSSVTNWAVAIGIPAQSLTTELRTELAWLALAIATLFASSLSLAWVIGGNISKSIHALTGPALALGAGGDVRVPRLHLREADEVGIALVSASKMLQHAKHQATHDTLTGLANRALFSEIVNQQLSVCERTSTNLSVLYIDLDDFKAVNDANGHSFGDKVLQQAAERLTSGIRKSDIAARLGGDEFAVVLVADTETMAMAVAVAGQLVDALSAPYTFNGVQVSISASIGVARYPECGNSSQELLHVADETMYRAKASGKRKVVSACSVSPVQSPDVGHTLNA